MERKQKTNGPLELFVIYERPKDYPAHFVVRRWFGMEPTEDFAIADTLEAARKELPRGLYRIPRQPGEDPVIAETWV
jgi:hypothetical protein